MSLNKPHSVLSFIYNTTIDPPYRAEMHTDMQLAFDRFEVTNPNIQKSCDGVEQAAYRLRASSDDARASGKRNAELHATGRDQMASTTDQLFRLLGSELATKIPGSVNGTIVAQPVSLARSLDVLASADGYANAPWSPIAVTAEGVTVRRDYLLLEYAYFFLHFPEARRAILAKLDVIDSVVGLANPVDTKAQLALFDSALSGSGNVNAGALAAAIAAFCTTLQQEYEQRSWLECW